MFGTLAQIDLEKINQKIENESVASQTGTAVQLPLVILIDSPKPYANWPVCIETNLALPDEILELANIFRLRVQRGPVLHSSGEYYYPGDGYAKVKKEEISPKIDYKRTPIQPKMKAQDLISIYYFTDTKEDRDQAFVKKLTDSMVTEELEKLDSINSGIRCQLPHL